MGKQISKTKRALVFAKSNNCLMCNKKLQNLTPHDDDYMQIDHLIPKYKGGKNNIDNLMPLCRSCNSAKRDRDSIDIALSLKNNITNSFKNYYTLLISYEKSQGTFNKKTFDSIIDETTFLFIAKINELKEVSK